jgi:hypothetical protein
MVNPKGLYMVGESTCPLEQVQAITTLRSGRLIDNHVEEKKDERLEAPQNLHQEKSKRVSNEASSSSTPTYEYEPKVPFPKRLKAPSHFRKQEKKIQDMMETLKQVKINIPLLDAIKKILAYAKFIKDLCIQKRKSRKDIPKKVILTE